MEVSSSGQSGLRRSERICKRRAAALTDGDGRYSRLRDAEASSELPTCSTATFDARNQSRKRARRSKAVCPRPSAGSRLEDLGQASACSGLWGLLPNEVMDGILRSCTAQQLGQLEASCTFFRKSGILDRIAIERLVSIPRAKGLEPNTRNGERFLSLLHFVNSQSAAAAQATAVACASYHTAALLVPVTDPEVDIDGRIDARHALYTFGRGLHGQLGQDGLKDSATPQPVSLGYRTFQDNPGLEEETMPAVVSCGGNHSASISRRGELFAWGMGVHGELGLGTWVPLEVLRPRQCYTSIRIVSLAAGARHTLAIAENGSLWSCGQGKQGQLGHGTSTDMTRLNKVAALEPIRVVSAAAGATHSLALAADGALYTWGDGSYGQLGHAQLECAANLLASASSLMVNLPQKVQLLDPEPLTPDNRITAISAGAHHSMALTVGGALVAFGRNDQGQLGTGGPDIRWRPILVNFPSLDPKDTLHKRAVQVACGAQHSLVLLTNAGSLEVRTAGCSKWGQLGAGAIKGSDMFIRTQMRIAGVVAVQAGDEHSMAITSNGDLYVWGRGDCGQLGLGDLRCRRKPTILAGYKVVHPDKTLRRTKRAQPNTRPIDARNRPRAVEGLMM